MEWSSLNSLAEVGVGVNLAFGLIKGIRERFAALFEARLQNKVDTIKTFVSESPVWANGRVKPARIVIKIEDIRQHYLAACVFTEKSLVVFAFVVAFALTYFLFEAAGEPSRLVAEGWTWVMFGLVWAPLVLSVVFHAAYYWIARIFLRIRERDYRNATDLLAHTVTPTPAENGHAETPAEKPEGRFHPKVHESL